jgi:hypothetical protein
MTDDDDDDIRMWRHPAMQRGFRNVVGKFTSHNVQKPQNQKKKNTE